MIKSIKKIVFQKCCRIYNLVSNSMIVINFDWVSRSIIDFEIRPLDKWA